ncbi:DUF1983 domain-containing protein [Pseudomonas sp. MRSN 12121]|uniref:phage tail tip fiber protein n=1 Tax=Pseudomonas sp. MRSN 12121 TaxID=1611770 RepID=UPI000698B329|nr:DUF1983 domain-containing protein [Pseudomonas sp. MRSN 12121]
MKSEYRQVVESITSQEAKLAEVKKMHGEALACVVQTAELVKFNEASLKKYEDRLAEIERASIANEKLGPDWSVRVEAGPDGKKYVAGIGAGLESPFLVSADRWAINGSSGNAPQLGDAMKAGSVTSMLDAMASTISETSLGKDLLNEIGKGPAIADQVRDVIRAELRQGGILYRG